MASYKSGVDELSKSFEGFEVQHIARAKKSVLDGAFLEHLKVPSIKGIDEEYPAKSDSPLLEFLAIILSWT